MNNMSLKMRATLVVAAVGIALTGCADMNMSETQRNTAIGAGVGALAGAAIGRDAKGAAIGAGVGALGGCRELRKRNLRRGRRRDHTEERGHGGRTVL